MIEIYKAEDGTIKERNLDAPIEAHMQEQEAAADERKSKRMQARTKNNLILTTASFWFCIAIASIYLLRTEYWIFGVCYLITSAAWLAVFLHVNIDWILRKLLGNEENHRCEEKTTKEATHRIDDSI